MALNKTIRMANGLELSYHRVAMVKIDTNQQTTLLVHSYLDEEARNYEKRYAAGEIEGEPTFPYVDYRYLNCDYSPDMTVEKAYDYLKTLPEFEGATDV